MSGWKRAALVLNQAKVRRHLGSQLSVQRPGELEGEWRTMVCCARDGDPPQWRRAREIKGVEGKDLQKHVLNF